jgi:hypothetical protein
VRHSCLLGDFGCRAVVDAAVCEVHIANHVLAEWFTVRACGRLAVGTDRDPAPLEEDAGIASALELYGSTSETRVQEKGED